jgi:hypothetical protein
MVNLFKVTVYTHNGQTHDLDYDLDDLGNVGATFQKIIDDIVVLYPTFNNVTHYYIRRNDINKSEIIYRSQTLADFHDSDSLLYKVNDRVILTPLKGVVTKNVNVSNNVSSTDPITRQRYATDITSYKTYFYGKVNERIVAEVNNSLSGSVNTSINNKTNEKLQYGLNADSGNAHDTNYTVDGAMTTQENTDVVTIINEVLTSCEGETQYLYLKKRKVVLDNAAVEISIKTRLGL